MAWLIRFDTKIHKKVTHDVTTMTTRMVMVTAIVMVMVMTMMTMTMRMRMRMTMMILILMRMMDCFFMFFFLRLWWWWWMIIIHSIYIHIHTYMCTHTYDDILVASRQQLRGINASMLRLTWTPAGLHWAYVTSFRPMLSPCFFGPLYDLYCLAA